MNVQHRYPHRQAIDVRFGGQSRNAVSTPVEFASEPFLKFITLPSPSGEPAAPDLATTFSIENIPGIEPAMAVNPMVISFDGTSEPSLVFHDRNSLQIVGGARIGAARQSSQTFRVAASDFNYDFKADLATVTDEGIRIYRQESINSFRDVTAGTALPAGVLRARYQAIQTFDVDLDGDMDILLSPAIVTTPPVVLRNNGDGTFKELFPFAGLRDIRHFASADADGAHA